MYICMYGTYVCMYVAIQTDEPMDGQVLLRLPIELAECMIIIIYYWLLKEMYFLYNSST